MAENLIDITNFNLYFKLYFHQYTKTFHKKLLTKEKFKETFSKLKQKYRTKRQTLSDNSLAYIDRMRSFYARQTPNDKQLSPEDYRLNTKDSLESLRTFYEGKKEEVNVRIQNLQDFYQYSLCEKETKKLLKSATKICLLSGFALFNAYWMWKTKRISLIALGLSTAVFLQANKIIQCKINQRYKRRIRRF